MGTPYTGAIDRSWLLGLGDIPSVMSFAAVGDGVADDTAAFIAAFSASNWVRAPRYYTFKITAPIPIPAGHKAHLVLDSPLITVAHNSTMFTLGVGSKIGIRGLGASHTQIFYTGTGNPFTLTANPFIDSPDPFGAYEAGKLEGFALVGTSAATDGIILDSITSAQLIDIAIYNFTNAAASALHLRNGSMWTERATCGPLSIYNCKTGVRFSVGAGTASFSNTFLDDLRINLEDGQNAFVVENNAYIYHSRIKAIVKMCGNTTAFQMKDTANCQMSKLELGCEYIPRDGDASGKVAIGLDIAATCGLGGEHSVDISVPSVDNPRTITGAISVGLDTKFTIAEAAPLVASSLAPLNVYISGATLAWASVNGYFTATNTGAHTFTIPVDSSGFVGAITGTVVVQFVIAYVPQSGAGRVDRYLPEDPFQEFTHTGKTVTCRDIATKIGAYVIHHFGSLNSWRSGFGMNLWFDPTDNLWHTGGDGANDSGWAMLSNYGEGPKRYWIPTNTGSGQAISDANLANYEVDDFPSGVVRGGVWVPDFAFKGPVKHKDKTVTYGATPSFDLSESDRFLIVLTGDCSPTFDNAEAEHDIVVTIAQDGGGGHLFNWPANVHGGDLVNPGGNTVNTQCFRTLPAPGPSVVLQVKTPMVDG